MGAKTTIAWCHHTFNAWWGCHKVSPACKNCYAESFSKRTGHAVWGADAPRRFFGEKHWAEPLKWNRAAEKAGERRRVFCGSMMDIFELHDDDVIRHRQSDARHRLRRLIADTPWLDWLLLTKRPENVRACTPPGYWEEGYPPNVWMGTTVENQEYADLRIPHLLKIQARVRFLSCEPLLGPIDLARWIKRVDNCDDCGQENPPTKEDRCPRCQSEKGLITTWGEAQAERYRTRERYENGGPSEDEDGPQLHWLIAGGESGHHHREHQLEWSRSLRDQCAEAGVAYFMKQLGERATQGDGFGEDYGRVRLPLARGSKGESLDEIPPDLRVRQFPRPA